MPACIKGDRTQPGPVVANLVIFSSIVMHGITATPAPMETSISPGEMEVSLSIQVGYAILQ